MRLLHSAAWAVTMVLLASFTLAKAETKVAEVIWTTDPTCVSAQCRLRESATLGLLTKSCARERCSVPHLVPSTLSQLHNRQFALVLSQFESNTVNAIIKNLDGIVDLFVLEDQTSKSEPGFVDIYENGEKRHHRINLIHALKRGSFGGIRDLKSGPVPNADRILKRRIVLNEGQLVKEKRSLKECMREIRRNSVGIRDEDMEEYIKVMTRTCLVNIDSEEQEATNEDPSKAAVKEHRDELWVKALELGLVPDNELKSLSASSYFKRIWNEVASDTNREHEFWLSVSWVPVFDELHEGLGHGNRYEVLLLELIHAEGFNEIPDVTAVISTKSGLTTRVRHRRLLALSACDDDELESVLRCIRASVPNVFLFNQVVWGMGFVADDRYAELEPDWNADPVYYSTGEMPPKYEDELKKMNESLDESRPKMRDEI